MISPEHLQYQARSSVSFDDLDEGCCFVAACETHANTCNLSPYIRQFLISILSTAPHCTPSAGKGGTHGLSRPRNKAGETEAPAALQALLFLCVKVHVLRYSPQNRLLHELDLQHQSVNRAETRSLGFGPQRPQQARAKRRNGARSHHRLRVPPRNQAMIPTFKIK